MDGKPAIIVSKDDLRELLTEIASIIAKQVVTELGLDTNKCPKGRNANLLRRYIQNRNSINNPREHWASSHDIRRIITGKNGNPRSYSWFQDFKKTSRLAACFTRKSPIHGKLKEWCFEDIANAWEVWEAR